MRVSEVSKRELKEILVRQGWEVLVEELTEVLKG